MSNFVSDFEMLWLLWSVRVGHASGDEDPSARWKSFGGGAHLLADPVVAAALDAIVAS